MMKFAAKIRAVGKLCSARQISRLMSYTHEYVFLTMCKPEDAPEPMLTITKSVFFLFFFNKL